MRCFYCKTKLPKEAESDICDVCLFHVDDIDREYDDDVQRDIEAVVNKTGLTPARYID